MKKSFFVTLVFGCVLCMSVSSCVCINGCQSNLCSPVTKEITSEREMAEGMTFSAETMHSYIKITGWDQNNCSARVKVKVRAENTEKANKIAESIRSSLKESANKMTLITDQLGHHGDYSVYADYDVKLPRNSNVILKTTHGTIECRNLKGNVTAKTTHDPIICSDISGSLKLDTSHDPIKLTNITGKVEARTTHDPIEADNITGDLHLSTSHDNIKCNNLNTEIISARTTHGNVNITFSEQFTVPVIAEVTTSHGDISFDPGLNYSGWISMSTSHGKIKTELPITVNGEMSEKMINGMIGGKDGEGKINLKTSHGSIFLK